MKIIRFCYRKIIDSTASRAWDRLVHEDSYTEFKMQSQRFNQDNGCTTFSELLQYNPSAEQLHFLVGSSVTPYIKHLEEKIPDIFNVLGKQFLPFQNFRFEIINSDLKNISKHSIAINFYSIPVAWLDTVADKMIISITGKPENSGWLTETIAMQPFLSIYSIQQ